MAKPSKPKPKVTATVLRDFFDCADRKVTRVSIAKVLGITAGAISGYFHGYSIPQQRQDELLKLMASIEAIERQKGMTWKEICNGNN